MLEDVSGLKQDWDLSVKSPHTCSVAAGGLKMRDLNQDDMSGCDSKFGAN